MTARPLISNTQARSVFLECHALTQPTAGRVTGKTVCDVVGRLGFVQVDSINTVARAHDLILHSRLNCYRPGNLRRPLERDRALFEHWTHDAAIIPSEFFPHWRLRFDRDRVRLRERWERWGRSGFEDQISGVLRQISDCGPVCSSDVREKDVRSNGGWWEWHPSKTALEYLWRTGVLMVTRREGFRKYFDLTERVLPDSLSSRRYDTAETVDWACNAAMERLGFATSGEVAAFWDLASPSESKKWCAQAVADGRLIEVDIESADGRPRRSFAVPGILDCDGQEPPQRVRILSPFDPCLRDRKRAERLFGFHYRIEVFVPEHKREFGYYVFPVMEGSRMIGRVDMKHDRSRETLDVLAFWPEASTRMGQGRLHRFRRALERIGNFVSASDIEYASGWLR